MTPPQWQRLKTLFEEAVDRPSAERRAWLRQAAAGDEALLREVEALLEAHDTAGDFLEGPIEIDPNDLFPSPGPADQGGLVSPKPIGEGGGRLGPYTILEEIGRGGMGVVYLAEDERLKRRVALKVLPPAVADNSTLRERLRREARAAATISHPAVAVVYALEEIDDELVLVTEYVPGTTLRQEISRGAVPAARALAVATNIVKALAAAHDAGVIHRDLKPENVLLTRDGGVKVVDFGIAHLEGTGLTRLTLDGALVGTPAYMAPEQLAGARVDARADLYAAGLVLAEMLTGHHPMISDSGGPPLPPAFATVVSRCLAQDPAARYGSARELLQALEQAAGTPSEQVAGGFQASEASGPFGPSRTPARWWWEFHQGVAALTYWLMVIPAWIARGIIGGPAGRVFFIATLAAVIVSATLRLHLWFTSRFYAAELRWLRARVTRWIHAADWLFAIALITSGLAVGDERPALAVLLLSFGIGSAVGFLVIERATTRAAFRSSSSKHA